MSSGKQFDSESSDPMERIRAGGQRGGTANTEAQQEGRSKGGHTAQEKLHSGAFKGGIDTGEDVQEEIAQGLASDDPMERIRAGGKKGGKTVQAKYHQQDPSNVQNVTAEEK